MNREMIDLTLHLHHETPMAILVSETGDEKKAVWLPKSQCDIEGKRGSDSIIVTLPEWLALREGLI